MDGALVAEFFRKVSRILIQSSSPVWGCIARKMG
jgi:hypothetical protein